MLLGYHAVAVPSSGVLIQRSRHTSHRKCLLLHPTLDHWPQVFGHPFPPFSTPMRISVRRKLVVRGLSRIELTMHATLIRCVDVCRSHGPSRAGQDEPSHLWIHGRSPPLDARGTSHIDQGRSKRSRCSRIAGCNHHRWHVRIGERDRRP